MAVQTLYVLATNAVTPNFWGNLQVNGTAPTGANTAYGFQPSRTALTTPYYRGRLGAVNPATASLAASYNAAATGPTPGTGTAITTAGDSFVSGPWNGTFAATAWTFNWNMRAGTTGGSGRINMRVWKSSSANGSSPTQLLANTNGATITPAATDTNSSISWSPGALTLNNEYLFFQVEWQQTTVSATNNSNVFFRAGTAAITTPDFVPAVTGTLNATQAAHGLAGAGTMGPILGTLNRTQANATLSGQGTATQPVVLPPITGELGGAGGPFDPYTILLLHGEGADGSTSFTNSSAFAYPLTAGGGADITTAASKFGTSSLDFTAPGGTAYINAGDHPLYRIGTQPFTMEAWAYFTTLPGTSESVICARWGPGAAEWHYIFAWYSGALTFIGPGPTFYASSYTVPPLNTWIHIAVDRDVSGMMRMYVNGAVVFEQTVTRSLDSGTSMPLIIGGQDAGAGANRFPGYLDDLRISNGIARYGGAFTPPTAPLPDPDPESITALLVHADGAYGSTTFTDSSGYARPASSLGSATVTNLAKFGGGSVWLNDVTAGIEFPNAPEFHFWYDEFTLEGWVYRTGEGDAVGYKAIVSKWGIDNNQSWWLGLDLNNYLTLLLTGNGLYNPGNDHRVSVPIPLNEWHHVAADRDAAGVVRLYIDGTVYFSGTDSVPIFESSLTVRVGSWVNPNGYWPGAIDEVRVTKSRARYGGAFTPPTAPFPNPGAGGGPYVQADQTLSGAGTVVAALPPITGSLGPPDTNTVLLVHADGADGSTFFTDSSLSVHTLFPVNGSQLTTATAKFGSASLATPASNSNVTVYGSVEDFQFGAGPFTIEAWIYLPATVTVNSVIFDQGTGVSGNQGIAFYADNTAGLTLRYVRDDTTIGTRFTTNAGIPLNTWTHVAVERDAGGTLRFYRDGIVINSFSVPETFFASTVTPALGNLGINGNPFQGYIDEIRVSKVARYGGAFTPPLVAFDVGPSGLVQANETLAATGGARVDAILGSPLDTPLDANTVLLCHADDDGINPLAFKDSSLSAHTLVSVNSAQTNTISKKFGNASLWIPFAGTYVEANNKITDFHFGSGQFTVEAWGYATATPNNRQCIVSQWNGTVQNGWMLSLDNGWLEFVYSTTGSNNPAIGTDYSPPLNTWVHYAADRDASNVIRVYADGVVIASGTAATTFYAPNDACRIGNTAEGNRGFPGYLDEIRVSKGVARYAGAFTPQTRAFSDSTTATSGITQAGQSLTGSGTVGAGLATITGTLNATQAGQTSSTAVTVSVGGTLNQTAAPQTLTGKAASIATAGLIAGQSAHSLAGFAGAVAVGTASLAQAPQSLEAVAGVLTTATLTATQVAQGLAGFASVGPLGVSGTLNATQAAQSLGAVAATLTTATLTATQVAHGLTGKAGALTTGTASLTQAPQSLAGVAGGLTTATLTATQAAQGVGGVAGVPVGAKLNASQAAQSLDGKAGSLTTGALTATQVAHALTGLAGPLVNATLALTQAGQALDGRAATAGNTLAGSMAQGPQSLAGIAGALVNATLTRAQDGQTVSGSGQVITGIGGGLNATQAAQTLTARGTVDPILGTATLTQAPQSLTGQIQAVLTASLNSTQSPQALAGKGEPLAAGKLTATQAAQSLDGAGVTFAVRTATLNATQAAQTLDGRASTFVGIGGALNATQAAQTLDARGEGFARATLTATQGAQSLDGKLAGTVGATLAATQAAHGITARATTSIGAILDLIDGSDIVLGRGQIATLATLTRTQGDNTMRGAVGIGDIQARVVMMA